MPPRISRLLLEGPSLLWADGRLLVESVVDYAIFMLDPAGYVVSWNPGAEKIKGYEASEIIGQHFSTFYTPEDLAAGKPERELQIAAELGRVEDEGWRIRKDGSRLWANVVITALRDDSGQLRGFGKVTRDLTARRAVEEELRQSEQRFHHLVDAVLDYAIFMLDEAGCVSTWNVGASRLKGYSTQEIIGKHFSLFYTSEDRAAGKPERILEEVRRVGRCEDESWRVRKDGNRFWANVVITALRDDHGQVIGYAKVTRDLTSRREAEQQQLKLAHEQLARQMAERSEQGLRESETRYRALSQRLEIVLEGVADGITVQDRSGRIVFANRAAAKLCGFDSAADFMQADPSQVLAQFEILNEAGAPLSTQSLPGQRVLAGEHTSAVVLHARETSRDLDWWALVRAGAVLGVDDEPELAISIWHDITERLHQQRQAQYLADATAALGTSLDHEDMLSTLSRVLVPGLGDWCSIYLVEGPELRAVSTVHVDPDQLLLVKDYQARFPPDPQKDWGVWHVVRTGQCQFHNDVSEKLLVGAGTPAERVAILLSLGMKAVLLAPIRVRGRVLGVIGLVSSDARRRYDRSDLSLVEELGRRTGVALENAELYAAAQTAAKTAEEASRAKDEFLATVSHELRTPLSAILGWSAILKERVKEGSVVKPIEVIHRNAEAQVKIIDDILDVSRVITGKFRLEPKPVDLVPVARNGFEVLRPSALAKNIDLQFHSDADYLFLVADADRLQQVVWNLVSNAVKFTPPGGSVRLTIVKQRSNAVLSVTDTGSGITPSFLPYVFDRFRQADASIARRVGGLGLGLALVRHIVELHGGHVTAASAGPGKGAEFSVSIPISTVVPPSVEPAPWHTSPAAARPLAPLEGIRVLVVDDEADALEMVAEILLAAGAVVDTAASAAAGFASFQRFRPDVLVSDIAMPGEDGYSLIRRLRALPVSEGGRIPCLALTAFAREEDRTKAISAGFTTHIGKPVSPEAITAAVVNLSSVRRRG